MSDHWITLIPEDPRFIPVAENQARARERFSEIAPDADEIEVKVSGNVEFFHCGTNFERVLCPSCGLEIAHEWWQARMSDDHRGGFLLDPYPTPCCGTRYTLHELRYEWPQGFGRFALEAMNPNIGELEEQHQRELEAILGTRLRVIYQHL